MYICKYTYIHLAKSFSDHSGTLVYIISGKSLYCLIIFSTAFIPSQLVICTNANTQIHIYTHAHMHAHVTHIYKKLKCYHIYTVNFCRAKTFAIKIKNGYLQKTFLISMLVNSYCPSTRR